MKRGDVTCPSCGAGFRRLELQTAKGGQGEFRCPTCGELLEVFESGKLVVYRMTVQPSIRALSND